MLRAPTGHPRRSRLKAERLTPRELAALEALATGLSCEEAAERQSMGAEGVRAALKRAMAKLGARTKLEALVLAIREGLIDPPPR